MRISAILAGVFFVSAILLLSPESANAISFNESIKSEPEVKTLAITDSKVSIFKAKAEPKKATTKKPVKKVKKSIKHTVKQGETLSQIAATYKINWQKVYDKNKSVSNPNQINPGDVLVIPDVSEKLKARSIADSEAVGATEDSSLQPAVAQVNSSPAQTYTAAAASSAGNTYYYGYCTYYAKSRRPDLPNNLGNADTWVSSAAAQGFATGSAPRAGAVGQQGMHVVYVEAVNADGTVTVSEMNFNGWGVISSRTVPAGTFSYIY